MFNIFKYEFLMVLRSGSHLIIAFTFFFFFSVLFALSTLGTETLVNIIAPSGIWVSLLISVLLTLNKIIHQEYENGSTDFYLLSDFPLEIILFFKTIVHWITVSLPMLLIMPFIMIALQIDLEKLFTLLTIVLIGSPALSFVGIMISCITLSNNSSFLITTITIPFYFPTLLLGIYCTNNTDLDNMSLAYILLSLNTLFTITISPFISAYAVKLHYS